MLYIVSPDLTHADAARGRAFLQGLAATIAPRDLEVLQGDHDLVQAPSQDDIVVVFNPVPTVKRFGAKLRNFLSRADGAGAHVMAVALDEASQDCPEPLKGRVPYPVHDVVATYRFTPSQLVDVGRVYGRTVRSRLYPTYARDKLQIFLSYRQFDGQQVARRLGDEIKALNHDAYRDFADLADDTVDERVRRALDECDVLVLLDTPAAAGSSWIKSELCIALSTGVPIVWVRLGQSGPSALPVRPADKPDIALEKMPEPTDDLRGVAIDVLATAFEHSTTHIRRIENFLHRLQSVLDVRTVDDRQRVFELRRARSIKHHPVRDETHVVQLFGRRPTVDDARTFTRLLEFHRYDPLGVPHFDVAAMVSPTPGTRLPEDRQPKVMHAGAFLGTVLEPHDARSTVVPAPQLLIFASFSPSVSTGQPVRDAVQEIASYWLSQGGQLVFGGHPTITPTVNYVASSIAPGAERDFVTIYQSNYFVTKPLLLEIARRATVIETEATGVRPEDRAHSLTVMRERMIGDSSAVAAVVIGGLTPQDLLDQGRTEIPGVEEEMLLARRSNIPVFLLAHTGGHAAILADRARHTDPPWVELGNRLSSDENEDLIRTDDYWGAAETIWSAAVDRRDV